MKGGTLPQDIPADGERYDLTLDVLGQNAEGEWIARFIIDNGKYKGKRVSMPVRNASMLNAMRGLEKSYRMSALLRRKLVARFGTEWREVDEWPEGAQKLVITYNLTNILPATQPSELAEVLNPQQKFTREDEQK
jgi:hypothetical protein